MKTQSTRNTGCSFPRLFGLVRIIGWFGLFAICPVAKVLGVGHWNLVVIEGKELALLLCSLTFPALGLWVIVARPGWLGEGAVFVEKHGKIVGPVIILLALASIVAPFWGMFDKEKQIHMVVEKAERELRPLILELERRPLQRPDALPSHQKVERPLLIYLVNDSVPIAPQSLGKLRLAPYWYRLSYPRKTVRDVEGGNLQELPPLNPRTTVIITQGEETGREIKLDDGKTIPSYRIWNVVTLIDIQTGCIMGQSDRILGPGASAPLHLPGIHYYSSRTGDEPAWSDVEAAIEKLCNPD